MSVTLHHGAGQWALPRDPAGPQAGSQQARQKGIWFIQLFPLLLCNNELVCWPGSTGQ